MMLLPAFTGQPELNRIYHCDALTLLRALPSGSVDMVMTSPPYDDLRSYNGFTFPFHDIARELYRVLVEGGVCVWVVADQTINGCETLTSMRQALYFVDVCGFNMHDTMIYEALGTGAKGSNRAYWQAFEYMFVLTKGNLKTCNRIQDVANKQYGKKGFSRWREKQKEEHHIIKQFGVRSNIWRYPVGFADPSDKTGHPAPYPEVLAKDHIKSWSNPDDTVFDPFTGSGTTAKAAKQMKRNFIGCDISHEYVEIARKRLQNTDPYQSTVHDNGVVQPSLFEVA